MKPGRPLAGRSTPFGFYLYGDVSDEDLQTAVYDALQRFEEANGGSPSIRAAARII